MTLRDTVTKWHAAMCLLEKDKLTEATHKLLEIQKPSAKILYNLGCIYMLQDRYDNAIQYLTTSLAQDSYLSVAFYQRGICYLETHRFDQARSDFLNARAMVRGTGIDYKQLGAEMLLTPQLLDHCVEVSQESSNKKELVNLQALPVKDCMFRPPKAVVDNLVKQDFLGSAKIISSTTEQDIVTASEKSQSLHLGVPLKNQTSISVPSSPASSRYKLNTSSAKQIFMPPPKPTRPPPRLPSNLPVNQELCMKSRSLEDVTSCDHLYESIEEAHLVSISSLTKQKPALIKSQTTSNLNSSLPHFAGSSDKPFVNWGQKDFEMNKVHRPLWSAKSVQNSLHRPGLAVNESRQQDISVAQVSSKSEGWRSSQSPECDINSGQGNVVGHAARMKSMFERALTESDMSDSREGSIGDIQRVRSDLIQRDRPGIEQRKRLDSAQQIGILGSQHDRISSSQNQAEKTGIATNPTNVAPSRTNIAQSQTVIAHGSLDLPTVHPSNVQKSPRPARPPPPKLSK